MFSFSKEQKNRLKNINIIRVLIFLSIIICFITLFTLVQNLFISFLLAFIIAYLTRPLITPLERVGVSYTQALIFIFILGIGVIVTLSISAFPFILDQLENLQKEWPRYSKGLIALIELIELKVKNLLNIELKSIEKTRLLDLSTLIVKNLPSFILQSITVVLLAPFLAFFILKNGHQVSKQFMLLVPNSLFEMTLDLQYKINKQLGQFIRARFLEGFIVGVITFVGLSLISFPFALLLGAFAAITNLIPYLGPIIGALPAVIIALVNNSTPIEFTLLISVYIITQLIDTGVLIPVLVARIVNLNPVTVVLLIIIGGQFMGILGMIICIPLANALKVTFLAVYQHITQSKQLNL